MTDTAAVETVVVIPARNEAQRISACLDMLAPQAHGVPIVLVVNDTVDDTAGVARRIASERALILDVIECRLQDGQGVGGARRIGCAAAIGRHPHLRHLLTTDADCLVAPIWVARSLDHLRNVAAVCGKIGVIEAESAPLAGIAPGPASLEGRYRDLVLRWYARVSPEPCNPWPHHGEVPGASLGIRVAAYTDVGGFRDIANGEDRDLVHRLKCAGHDVRHADDVEVRASCRLVGRAPDGMSEALRARIAGEDYFCDATLPRSDWLLARTRSSDLGPWPPRASKASRLRVSELPQEIAAIEAGLQLLDSAATRQGRDDAFKQAHRP